jgi:adenylate cyclase
LLQSPYWLNSRREEVVVLSVDLVDSTKFAHAEPDAIKVFHHINKYLGLIGTIIKNDFNGTLDKYIGDEVMGIFGAPVKDANCAMHGTECALHIMKEIANYNRKLSEAGEQIFSIKITLGLVNAVVGEVGSEDTQTDYTVIGSGVSDLFRLAKYTEPNKIYINEALQKRISHKYETKSLGNLEAKGVAEGIPAYEMVLN